MPVKIRARRNVEGVDLCDTINALFLANMDSKCSLRKALILLDICNAEA